MDAITILKQINEGKSLLGDEYEFASVENYSISQSTLDLKIKNMIKVKPKEYGIEKMLFSINAYKKGEDSKFEGKRITTNYYTVPFIVNEDESVEIREKQLSS